jgi:hypothetical protein
MAATPRIAIVGDASKARSPDLARKAAEALGAELARRGCKILVFSSDPAFIEFDVVKGYRDHKSKKEPGAIQVRYPPELDGLFPNEKPGDPLFERKPMGKEWEASFYPALADVDGLILIGGGYTTKVTGLIALGARTPLLVLAGLGGATEEVLESLRADRRTTATDDELNLMAQRSWTGDSAAPCVESLLAQERRRAAQERQSQGQEVARERADKLAVLALVGSLLFVAVLFCIADVGSSEQLSRTFLLMLFGAPAVAGASGSAIRAVWDHWRQDANGVTLRPVIMTIALGFWASGVAGALFVLPQIVAVGNLQHDQASRLMPFATLIGLLAGLTLDKVFPRLIKTDVPLNVESLEPKQPKISKNAA